MLPASAFGHHPYAVPRSMRPSRLPFIAIVPSLLLIPLVHAPAGAQLTVEGLAWGAPAAQVRTQLEARGYRFHGVDQAGEHVFGGPGPSEVAAMFDSAGLVQAVLSWPAAVPVARRRFRVLADSLRTVLGRPRTVDGNGNELTWERDGVKLTAIFDDRRRDRGEAIASLVGETPGATAERDRLHAIAEAESRRNYAAGSFPRDSVLEGAWVLTAGDRRNQVLLDTLSITQAGPGRFRVRIREEWRDLFRMIDGRFYDGELRAVEIDCAAGRWRRLRTLRFAGRGPITALPLLAPAEWAEWTAPAAGTKYGRALRQSCELARRAAAR
jgi:hypothetical protein